MTSTSLIDISIMSFVSSEQLYSYSILFYLYDRALLCCANEQQTLRHARLTRRGHDMKVLFSNDTQLTIRMQYIPQEYQQTLESQLSTFGYFKKQGDLVQYATLGNMPVFNNFLFNSEMAIIAHSFRSVQRNIRHDNSYLFLSPFIFNKSR